jgi:hypothetical protein
MVPLVTMQYGAPAAFLLDVFIFLKDEIYYICPVISFTNLGNFPMYY